MRRRGGRRQRGTQFRPNARIQWMICAAALLALGLIYRLFDIQWIRTEEFKSRSGQTTISLRENIQRGGILDRNLRELAVSKNKYSISADPNYYRDMAKRVSQERIEQRKNELAQLLAQDHPKNMSAPQILQKINSKSGFEWIVRWIDHQQFEAVKERMKNANFRWYPKGALSFEVEGSRAYPRGSLAAHIVGYTNIDGKGVNGVELAYNDTIRSREIKKTGVKDARGRPIDPEILSGSAPRRAEGVVLTIDESIQFALERALQKQVEEHEAAAAVGIVMDPRNGDIIAMANLPTYDPNRYNDPSASAAAKRNQAIWRPYEPGSVFKAVTIAILIENGYVTDLNEIVHCENGSYKPTPRIGPIRDSHGYGELTVAEVIHKSSNIGVTKLASRMTQDQFRENVQRFYIDKKTGVDLPYERRGSIRDLSNPAGFAIYFAPWGQGISVTPLQMLTALNAVANGGVIMQPRVVHEIRAANGDLIQKIEPKELSKPISPRTARIAADILIGVVEEGTGTAVQIPGVAVAGKTGTSQKANPEGGGYMRGSYISSFAGFFPADKPEYSMIILIDEPSKGAYYGGAVAGPAFKAVAETILRNRRLASSEWGSDANYRLRANAP